MGTSFLLMCLKVNRLIEDYAGTAQEPGEEEGGYWVQTDLKVQQLIEIVCLPSFAIDGQANSSQAL